VLFNVIISVLLKDQMNYVTDAHAQDVLVEGRVATSHPENIRTVPSLTARYSKCWMFSVCVSLMPVLPHRGRHTHTPRELSRCLWSVSKSDLSFCYLRRRQANAGLEDRQNSVSIIRMFMGSVYI